MGSRTKSKPAVKIPQRTKKGGDDKGKVRRAPRKAMDQGCEPGYHFRGTHTPPEIHYLIEQGKITATEFLLLAIIDALTDPNGNGCWATNEYLGKRVNKSKWHVQHMLRKLKKMGLLIMGEEYVETLQNTRRTIETSWSRVRWGGVTHNTGGHVTHNTQGINVLGKREAAPADAGRGDSNKTMTKKPILSGFGNAAKKDGIPPRPVDVDRATRLKEIVANAKALTAPPKFRTKWATQMRLLANLVTEERIEKALAWIEKNMKAIAAKEKGYPPIYSADAFRRHFMWIEERIEKDSRENPEVTETPLGAKITDWARRLKWPAGADAKLRPAVEQSITNYQAFRDAIRDWQLRGCFDPSKNPKGIGLFRLADHVRSRLGDPETFFARWWKDAFTRIKNAPGKNGWTGTLMNFVFTPKHRIMEAIGRGWSKDYCGDADRWDRLLEAVL